MVKGDDPPTLMAYGQTLQHVTPTLQAGRLRHRIDILQPTGAQDAAGGTTLASSGSTVFATIWATVEPISGNEQLAAQEFTSVVTHQIVIRYLSGVSANMQVRYSGRIFQILAVLNPLERNKVHVLLCVEINNSAQES